MEKEYINGQGLSPYKEIKFMSSTLGRAGCGPIAVYNILCTLGESKSLDEIMKYFTKHKIINLNGILGISLFTMIAFLTKENYKCRFYIVPNLKRVDEIIKRDGNGILQYFHGKGSHFVAVEYNKYNDSAFTVYNKSNYFAKELNYRSLTKMKAPKQVFIPLFLITVNKRS